MNILALDLGTKTGWCLSETGRIESGVQTFDVKRGESPGMRYMRFNRWLDETLIRVNPLSVGVSIIVYEQTHNRGGAATEIAAGFATRVQEFCASWKIEHAAIHSATLKKWTTGHGRSDKSRMIEVVRAKWKADVVSDDEADAVALAMYALSEIVP